MYRLVSQPEAKDKENTLVRAVVMPVACPVSCLTYDKKRRKWIDATLAQPEEKAKGKRKGTELSPQDLLWHHFREQLKTTWHLAARAANWCVRELLKHEPSLKFGDKLTKPEPVNLYKLFTKLNPDAPAWDGMQKSRSSLIRLIESKYRSERLATIALNQRSAPSFKNPQPFPVHNQDWFPAEREDKKDGDGDFFVAFPLGLHRWIVRLRRDPTSMKFNPIWEAIQRGELTRCEAQIYGQRVHGNDNRNGMTVRMPGGGEAQNVRVMFKAVVRVPRKPCERSDSTMLVRTDPNAMFVAEVDDRQPWILNADHVRRWIASHKVFLQRFSEDSKYEKRWPKDVRNRMNEHRIRRCDKQQNRVTTFVEQAARSLAEYARRNKVGTVLFDDSVQTYVESFPYFQFRLKLKDNLSEFGIELGVNPEGRIAA